jgi:hypothetical protein
MLQMKITKEQLRKIIMEEISSEGVVDKDIGGYGDEAVVTGPEGDASEQAQAGARLKDVILYLEGNERDDLAEPLRKIQEMLEML